MNTKVDCQKKHKSVQYVLQKNDQLKNFVPNNEMVVMKKDSVKYIDQPTSYS